MDFFYLKYVLLVLYMNELSVHYKPIETTQCFGQSNGATVNHASGTRRVQDERQLDANGMFCSAVKCSCYDSNREDKQPGTAPQRIPSKSVTAR